MTADSNKCQLKPLNRGDDYGLLGFTDAQWERMQALLREGVCDFSKPGVGRQATIPWQVYQAADGRVIYGGRVLSIAPGDSGGGWAAPAFNSFR